MHGKISCLIVRGVFIAKLLASSNSLSTSLIDIINVRQAFVQIYLTGDQMLKKTLFKTKKTLKETSNLFQPKKSSSPTSELPPVPASAVAEVCTGEFLPESWVRRGPIWFGINGNSLRLQPTSPPVVARVHHPRRESQRKDVSNNSVKELLVHPKAGKQN